MRIIIIVAMLSFMLSAQSKTKITITIEKDSLNYKQLTELVMDIQKIEKKYECNIKLEFENMPLPDNKWYLNGQLMENNPSYFRRVQ